MLYAFVAALVAQPTRAHLCLHLSNQTVGENIMIIYQI